MRTLLVLTALATLIIAPFPARSQEGESEKPTTKELKPKAKADKGPAPKESKSEKREPHFRAEVKLDESTDDFDSPSRALTMLGRAVAAQKRSKSEKDKVAFEATIEFEKNRRTFADAADALEACKALGEAIRDLKKAGISADELGDIPDAIADGDTTQWSRQRIKDGLAAVERRVNEAMQPPDNNSGIPNRPRTPRPPSLQQIAERKERYERLYEREINRAKEDGLLPPDYVAKPSTPQTPEEKKAFAIDEIRMRLQETYGKGAAAGASTPKEDSAS